MSEKPYDVWFDFNAVKSGDGDTLYGDSLLKFVPEESLMYIAVGMRVMVGDDDGNLAKATITYVNEDTGIITFIIHPNSFRAA